MTPEQLALLAIAATPLAAWPISIAYDRTCELTASAFGWLAGRGEWADGRWGR